jgi:hypothetical protein
MSSQAIQGSGVHIVNRGRLLWIVMVPLCAIGAAAVTRRLVVLGTAPVAGPPQFAGLDASFAAKAGITPVHIVPSLLFVPLVPLQFVPSLRRRRPRLHRWTGRVLMSLGVVIGITALRLSVHPVGGAVEATATILFGCYFPFCLGKAWWHIRTGQMELHRVWATRMVAIALGVATTRPRSQTIASPSGAASYAAERAGS